MSRKPRSAASGKRSLWPGSSRRYNGRQEQQRNDEHHSEVVRVAGQRVHAVDARLPDGAPDVDRRRAAGDRVQHERVEVPAAKRRDELEHPVGRIRREPRREPADRAPVEALGATREVGDTGRQEREVDRELRQALLVQRQRLLRLDVEEAAEVDDAGAPPRTRARRASSAARACRARQSGRQ